MMSRSSFVLTSYCLALLACSGHTDTTAPAAAGAGATAGAANSAGASHSGTTLPPTAISDVPQIVGPSPVACVGVPAPDMSLVHACVLMGSCSPYPAPFSMSDCISQALPGSGALPTCTVGAQSCAEMDACLGTGFYTDPCPELGVPLCVGTKAVHCGFPRYYRDCAKLGATCVEFASQEGGEIDEVDCAVEPTCAVPTDVPVCNGTKRVLCQGGIGFGEDCAAHGMTCVAAPEGAFCAQRPASCSELGNGSCDASGNASFCAAGRAFQFDCSRLSFTCREAPERGFGGECADPACSVADAAKGFEECDG